MRMVIPVKDFAAISKYHWIPQQRYDTCGIACVSYLLRLNGYDFSEEELYPMTEYRGGMSDRKVMDLLAKFKITLRKDEIPLNALMGYIKHDAVRFPFICTVWCEKDSCQHYVLVVGADKKNVFLLDPDRDASKTVFRKMSYPSFKEYAKLAFVEIMS